jgi:hypothetical protein
MRFKLPGLIDNMLHQRWHPSPQSGGRYDCGSRSRHNFYVLLFRLVQARADFPQRYADSEQLCIDDGQIPAERRRLCPPAALRSGESFAARYLQVKSGHAITAVHLVRIEKPKTHAAGGKAESQRHHN